MKNPFLENGEFSWRKAGTAICYMVFATACIGYLITHGFDELPKTYQGIITAVFISYFGKDVLRKTKIITKD